MRKEKQRHPGLYDYRLPMGLIAQTPAAPRDAARLLVYDRLRRRISEDTFQNLGAYIPRGALIIFNDTKVIPARLELLRGSGGRVRVLILGKKKKEIKALADRPLSAGEVLRLNRRTLFRVGRKLGREYALTMQSDDTLDALLRAHGTTPLPPYLRNSPLSEQKRKTMYQAIFAHRPGAIAAPTASLHFTGRLLANLKKSGIHSFFITLHVGLGTFAPVTESDISAGKLHRESYSIPKKTWRAIKKAKQEGRPVIAVGTTVVRALESAARTKKLSSETSLFIREGYRFKIADGLITNFHVPKSSLLMLVAAFTGRREMLRLYRRAIKKNYRFFSFGDGMYII